MEVAEFAFNLL